MSHRWRHQALWKEVQEAAVAGNGQRHIAGRCGNPGCARDGRGGRNGRLAVRRRADLAHAAAAKGEGHSSGGGHHKVGRL